MITVLFSCRSCGLVDVPCRVRARREEEPLMEWFDRVLLRDTQICHLGRSLLCEADNLQNLKIPIEDTPDFWLGKQTDIIPKLGN